MPTNQEKIYDIAKANLGVAVAPTWLAELGCAITVYKLLVKAGITLPVEDPTSTESLYKCLCGSSMFTQVTDPEAGDIIISPTGSQPAGSPLQHGHTGIVLKYGIGSNDSMTGTFRENFTLDGWKAHYHDHGGFPVLFFRAN